MARSSVRSLCQAAFRTLDLGASGHRHEWCNTQVTTAMASGDVSDGGSHASHTATRTGAPSHNLASGECPARDGFW